MVRINKHLNVNCFELSAITLAVKTFLSWQQNIKHLCVMSDSTIAIAYINNQGGTKLKVWNHITKKIWYMCMDRTVDISVTHMIRIHGTIADSTSRNSKDVSEWMLSKGFFFLGDYLGIPELCSRITQKQVVIRKKLMTSSTQHGETNINISKNANISLKDKRRVLKWKRN